MMSPERKKLKSDGGQSDGMEDDATAVVQVPTNEPPQWANEQTQLLRSMWLSIQSFTAQMNTVIEDIEALKVRVDRAETQRRRRPKIISRSWRPG